MILINLAFKNSLANSVLKDPFFGRLLKVYSGQRPIDIDDPGHGTLLVSIALPLALAVDGIVGLNSNTTGVAVASGVASWAVVDSPSSERIDGTVSAPTGNGDFILEDINVVASAAVTLVGLKWGFNDPS